MRRAGIGNSRVENPPPSTAPSSLIVFRASFETENHQRFLDTQGNAISVAEAKIRVAKELALEREFARRFDLLLKLVSPDGSSERELRDDNELVMPGAILVVQRTLWHRLEDVIHRADEYVTEWRQEREAIATASEPSSVRPKVKAHLDERFVCKACKGVLRSAMILRCASGCSGSVCKVCAERLLAESQPALCPMCSQAVKNFIPNKALISMISKLDLSTYVLPDRHEVAEPPPAPVEAPAFMIFLRPQQIQLVHEGAQLLVPTANYELVDEILRSTQPVTLIVFSSSGGGTSLLAPGILRVTHIAALPAPDAPANCNPAPDAAARPLEDPLTEQAQIALRKTWCEDDEADNKRAYLLCKCMWELRFDTVALLPGKAQPIAGIWSGARRIFATQPSKHFESTRLSPAHKQGIATRLGQEAVYSRAARHQQPQHQSQPQPPQHQHQPPPQQQQLSASASVPSERGVNLPAEALSGGGAGGGGGEFVFNPAANAWTGSNTTPKDRLRGTLMAGSKFATLSEEMVLNPLLPLASLVTKLDRPAFLLLQRVQELALQLLASKGPVSPDLMKNLRGIKGNAFGDSPPSSMPSSSASAAAASNRPAEPPKIRQQRSTVPRFPTSTPYDMVPPPQFVRPQQPDPRPGWVPNPTPVVRRRPPVQQQPQPQALRPVYPPVRPWMAPEPMRYMPPPQMLPRMVPVRRFPTHLPPEEIPMHSHMWPKPRLVPTHERPLYSRPHFSQPAPMCSPPGGFYSGIQSIRESTPVRSDAEGGEERERYHDRERERGSDRACTRERDYHEPSRPATIPSHREVYDREASRPGPASHHGRLSHPKASLKHPSERDQSRSLSPSSKPYKYSHDPLEDSNGMKGSDSRSTSSRFTRRGSVQDNRPGRRGSGRREELLLARSLPNNRLLNDRMPIDRIRNERSLNDGVPLDRVAIDHVPVERLPTDRVPVERLPIDRMTNDRVPMDRVASSTVWSDGRHSKVRSSVESRVEPREAVKPIVISTGEAAHTNGSSRDGMPFVRRRGHDGDDETSKRLARQQRFGTNIALGSRHTDISDGTGAEKRVFLMVDEFRKAGLRQQQERDDRKRGRREGEDVYPPPSEGTLAAVDEEPKRRRREEERRRAVHLEEHSPPPMASRQVPSDSGRREDGLGAARMLVASLPNERRHRQSSTTSLRRRRRAGSPQRNEGCATQSKSKKRPRNSLYT